MFMFTYHILIEYHFMTKHDLFYLILKNREHQLQVSMTDKQEKWIQ